MGAGQEAVAAASLPRADAAVAASVKDNRHFSFVDDFVKRNCAEREVCSLRRLCVLCGEASVASKRNPLWYRFREQGGVALSDLLGNAPQ
jgi:hypothetical protein